MDEQPGFVATIEDAPGTFVRPMGAIAPTDEHTVLAPHPLDPPRATPPGPRPRSARRPPRPARAMSRILLIGIAAAFALYGAGIGGNLLGLIRGGASARTVEVDGGSLLRASALEAALRGLPPGQVETLRVAADRIDARVVVDGRVRLVRVTRRGWVADLPSPDRPSGRTVKVDPRAPARFVRTVTRRTGRRAGAVSFVELDGARWQLMFGDGRQFSADTHGREVRAG
jgi:hypothetical protein